MLLRWYRRCVLLSAMDGKILENPFDENGGSFTGPSFHATVSNIGSDKEWECKMGDIVDGYLRDLDGIPHHFQLHLMHAIEIVGYKHPDRRIRGWWNAVYLRLVRDMHLSPETEDELDRRLGDSRTGWLEFADKATVD